MAKNEVETEIIGIFKTMEMLLATPCTENTMVDMMRIHPRTVRKYLLRLESIGFVIDQDFKGRYFINTDLLPKFVQALNVNQTV